MQELKVLVNKLLLYGFYYLLILIVSSCNDEDSCPRCFEDIVTCKVNGKKWRSDCMSNEPLFGCRAVSCYYYIKSGNGFDLNVSNDLGNTGIVLTKNSASGGVNIGENPLLHSTDMEYWNRNITSDCKIMYKDSNLVSSITIISIDTIYYIIEGTFKGFVANSCGDTLTISDGYFKTKFLF